MKQKEQCYPKLSACWPGDDRLFAHFPPAERVKPKYRPACPAVMRGQQQECKTDKGDGLTARFCCSFDENKKRACGRDDETTISMMMMGRRRRNFENHKPSSQVYTWVHGPSVTGLPEGGLR
jgi:hypothetical protein